MLLTAKGAALARAGDLDAAAALAQEASELPAAAPPRGEGALRTSAGGVDLAALEPGACAAAWRAAAQAKEEGNAAYRRVSQRQGLPPGAEKMLKCESLHARVQSSDWTICLMR